MANSEIGSQAFEVLSQATSGAVVCDGCTGGRGPGLRCECCRHTDRLSWSEYCHADRVAGQRPAGGQADGPSGCVGSNAPSGVGDAGATSNQICGAVLAFVGPSVGQVSSAMGPTIIGSTILAPVTVTSGPVVISSVP